MLIEYTDGDVTETDLRPVVIPHGLSDVSAYHSGVAAGIAKKWPNAQKAYLEWSNQRERRWDKSTGSRRPFMLGEIQIVEAEPFIYVANMITQKDICAYEDLMPFRYQSYEECLLRLRNWMDEQEEVYGIAAPRIGSLRAGGDWNVIEEITNSVFGPTEYQVVVYNYVEKSFKPSKRREDDMIWPTDNYVSNIDEII